MPLPLMIHSALALFAQRTRIPTSARSIGFCVIWVCISSSSSSGDPSSMVLGPFHNKNQVTHLSRQTSLSRLVLEFQEPPYWDPADP